MMNITITIYLTKKICQSGRIKKQSPIPGDIQLLILPGTQGDGTFPQI